MIGKFWRPLQMNRQDISPNIDKLIKFFIDIFVVY